MDCGLRRCNFTNLFGLCSADLDRLRSGSFYHHVKFCSLMYVQKIFTRVLCINGRHKVTHSTTETVIILLSVAAAPRTKKVQPFYPQKWIRYKVKGHRYWMICSVCLDGNGFLERPFFHGVILKKREKTIILVSCYLKEILNFKV